MKIFIVEFNTKNSLLLIDSYFIFFFRNLYVFEVKVYKYCRGLVPLHNASSFGHLEVVSLLLEAGADSQAEDLWNFTPLHESASKGRLEVCMYFLNHDKIQ